MGVREASVAYAEDWVTRSIADIAPLQRGFDLPSTLRQDGAFPVVYSNGVIAFHSKSMVRGPGVVTGRSGTLGSVHYVKDDFWPHNTSLWVTRFNGNAPLFVFYLFHFIGFERFASGSGVPTLNRNDAHGFRVAIPPAKAEQEAIAEALSDADALIESLQQLIAKKRQIKQGAMQALLTGQQRLSGFIGEWEAKSISELEESKHLKLSRGQVISKRHIDKVPGDFPIYSSSIHNDGLFGAYGEYMFDEELITWSVDGGGNFFHRAKHKFSVTNVCGFMRVNTSRIDYQFLAAELQLLHSRKNFDYMSKAHPSVIRKEYEVLLPPLAEQLAIATVVNDMDGEITALETRLSKTREIKQGMMQALLTGAIRLPLEQAA